MSLAAKLQNLADRVPKVIEKIETEEATKNALVLPFIAALGYDIFNPDEVVPEFNADVGVKKGEKVDYAIMRDGEIIMLFECKKASTNLSEAQFTQLYRYFSVTNARIAVLTNGIEYRLFSDLEEPNKLDKLPFLTFDLADLRETVLSELSRMTKEAFDLENMLSAASDLKYMSAIKNVLAKQFHEPSEEFVEFFFRRVHPEGRWVTSAKQEFTPLVHRTLHQFVGERVSDRLRSALEQADVASTLHDEASTASVDEVLGAGAKVQLEEGVVLMTSDGIVTTEEEIEGYHIVKSIVREVVDPARIHHRDTKSYMGILFDDNNRKPICRLHFNSSQWYLGIFDAEKKEERIPITALNDIYQHADRLRTMAQHWSVEE